MPRSSGALGVVLAALFALCASSAVHGQAQVTITVDPNRPAGTDRAGRVLLFAPNPVQGGSSISHWDRSTSPDLLMEPSVSPFVAPLDVDLTRNQLQDIGWTTNGGAVIQLQFTDTAGNGFNDPVLGSQRRNAMRRAADVWQNVLSSPVPITVAARFSSLKCDDDGATLAQAGSTFAFKVPTSRFPNSWYPGPLAEALAGQDLSAQGNPGAADINVTFNTEVDNGCLTSSNTFYYGLDARAPSNQIAFVTVALHEIGHGLGFATFINSSTGAKFMGAPDVYSHFIRDNVIGKNWATLSAAQIAASATRSGDIVWDGARVLNRAGRVLDPSPVLRLDTPPSLADTFDVSTASFGPSVQTTTVTGDLVEVNDGSANPTLGCNPPRNRSTLNGNVALIDRGTCLFVEKVKNAQDAGATAVVIVNNVPGLIAMGGSDNSIRIPTVMVSTSDGDLLRQAIDAGPDPDPDPDPGPDREPPSVCMADATTLCLNDNRFRVEADWRSAADSGVANAQEISDDTGYFWFFDDTNVEFVVKALDGCGTNNRYWVFAGGLTDVEVELTVVDTQTGWIQRYSNPLGSPFQPIQDTDAFDTCP